MCESAISFTCGDCTTLNTEYPEEGLTVAVDSGELKIYILAGGKRELQDTD